MKLFNEFFRLTIILNLFFFFFFFRNSALEYVNKLNQKYHLKMGEIKSKIVVFPGGVEFMHILFELTQLTLRITIKRNPGYSQ